MCVTSFLKSIQTSLTLIFHFNSCLASAGKSHESLSLCPGASYCGTGCLFLWVLKFFSDCPWLFIALERASLSHQLTDFCHGGQNILLPSEVSVSKWTFRHSAPDWFLESLQNSHLLLALAEVELRFIHAQNGNLFWWSRKNVSYVSSAEIKLHR